MVCIPAFLLLSAYLTSTVAHSSSDHVQGSRDSANKPKLEDREEPEEDIKL